MSRSLKTWGTSESALAEMVAHRLDALDAGGGNPTIAFLARGIEGLVVRVTAKAATEADARALVDLEEKELRLVLGDLVFGVDDETMEYAVLERLRGRGWSLGVAESLTGGLIGARIVKVAPCSMVIAGTLAEWRDWTGLRFAESGPAIVPDALSPVHVSLEQDHAVYVEPNIWLHHRV